MSKIQPLTAFRLSEKAARNRGQRSFPENALVVIEGSTPSCELMSAHV
jgi:hypothetical protein